MSVVKKTKKGGKLIEVKINDVVTFRTLIDLTKDFLGDVNLEFKRDPNMMDDEKQEDKDNSKDKKNFMV